MFKIKNGYYTLYENTEYEIDRYKSPNGVVFELITSDINSEKLGFNKRTSKTILTINGKVHTFKYDDSANFIYTKKIDLSEIGDVYRIYTYAIYHGHNISIESSTEDTVLLATSDKKFYTEYGFEEVDRNVYMKDVPFDEVELVDKREPARYIESAKVFV